MPVLSQSHRLGKLITPFGADELVLKRFDGTDVVDDLFEYRVEAISLDRNLDFDKAIGKHCSVSLETVAYGTKWFDGILTDAEWLGVGGEGQIYRLVLRPWLWLATRRRNQRIFHEMTVGDILGEVLADYAGPNEIDLTGSHPVLEYTVQFGETDYDFVRRMAARHGISFHFQADEGTHKLVLTDSHDGFKKVAGDTRKVVHADRQHVSDDEHFTAFNSRRRLTTGRVSLMDYNFKTPSAAMISDQESDVGYDNGKIEAYDYPGNFPDQGEGKKTAQIRLDQMRSGDRRFSGEGDLVSLSAGQKVTIADHPNAALSDKEYLALRCDFTFVAESYSSGMGSSEESFSGYYEFVETSAAYAPPPVATTQTMPGVQTALVVGAGEIDCDEFGRILVKFPWDLKGANSMRCRVAQLWAGAGWGSMFIPRIGMEVVVQFVDGDPDRPLVTGCVYNGENAAPYDLPGSKNINGMKSNSTEGGGGYNEMVFDDTKGNELIRHHAQYDLETKVLNDERRTVDVNRTTEIGNDDTITTGNNETRTIGVNRTTSIGTDETRTVGANESHTIGANSTIAIGANSTNTIGANMTNSIGANLVTTVGSQMALTVGGAMATTIAQASALNIGGASEVGVGSSRTTAIGSSDTLDVGSTLAISAGSKITLSVGASTIEMTSTSIKISSPKVEVSATQEFKSSAGMMSKHTAGAMMDIKGTLVKINS